MHWCAYLYPNDLFIVIRVKVISGLQVSYCVYLALQGSEWRKPDSIAEPNDAYDLSGAVVGQFAEHHGPHFFTKMWNWKITISVKNWLNKNLNWKYKEF